MGDPPLQFRHRSAQFGMTGPGGPTSASLQRVHAIVGKTLNPLSS
jgi:hypothetical protein